MNIPKLPIIIDQGTRNKFPELVTLILSSRSMDQSEQHYWVELLPSMDTEQTKDLKNILLDEQKSFENLDAHYAEAEKTNQESEDGIAKQELRTTRLQAIAKAEKQSETTEITLEENILHELDD